MNIEISPVEYEKRLNWNDAIFYCQLLTIDNKNDWRLPTKEELNYMYNSENDFVGFFYWTSTEDSGNNAWLQHMLDGQQLTGNCKNNRCYVRAVRTI